jgi:hypothetical protein
MVICVVKSAKATGGITLGHDSAAWQLAQAWPTPLGPGMTVRPLPGQN